MKKIILPVLALLVMMGTAVQAAEIPPHSQYSADMQMLNNHKVFDSGKFYIGKNAARLELTKSKQTQIQRYDKDVVWILIPSNKTYMEMQLQYNALVNYKPAGFKEEYVGEESLDGHPCKKYQISGKFMGKNVSSTIWKAQDLGGTVIKSIDKKGDGIEVKNIQKGTQPASLFEPPAGYSKMTLPGGMGDILKGLGN